MIDITKPLYVAGVEVKLENLSRGVVWPLEIHGRKYVNVERSPTTGCSTYYIDNGECQMKPDSPRLSNSKDENMLDLNKPLVFDGREAKVVHQFENGNLAVVVDGYGEVQHVTSLGTRPGSGLVLLKNKVVEDIRYVCVYPDWTARDNRLAIHNGHSFTTTEALRKGASTTYGTHEGSFVVKQTLIDGKVVKSELV